MSGGMTAREILLEAAKLVRAGWNRYTYVSEDGTCFCALGALRKVAWGDVRLAITGGSPYHAVVALLDEIDPKYWYIGAWNDAPGQTAENVAATMERAAGRLS